MFQQTIPQFPNRLYFYRCVRCLSTMTARERYVDARCDCGGQIEFLGQVAGDRILDERHVVPCDARCTNAQGPICECGCLGENHGTQRLVTIYVDAGRAVFVPFDANAKARGAEYDEAMESARLALVTYWGESLLQKVYTGQWVPDYNTWSAVRADLKAIQKAKDGRTHTARMKKLRAIIERPYNPPCTPYLADLRERTRNRVAA